MSEAPRILTSSAETSSPSASAISIDASPGRSSPYGSASSSSSTVGSMHAPSLSFSIPSPPHRSTWTESFLSDMIVTDKLVTFPQSGHVDKAFELMAKKQLTCLPLVSETNAVVEYLDYSHLNCYLLLVTGQVDPSVSSNNSPQFIEQVETARKGVPAQAAFAAQLGVHDPLVRLAETVTLEACVKQFASGVHRIASVDAEDRVTGILSQRRMVRYIWNNIRLFPLLDQQLEKSVEELKVGTYGQISSIQGDAPLIDALVYMHENAISSVAVVDKDQHILGNISVNDTALLTSTAQSHLLSESCRHFLTVILDNRGLQDGKDVVPVFYVFPSTPMNKILAKLVATQAHRLWIVDKSVDTDNVCTGRLRGVISLTDVLNWVARQGGKWLDPETARRHRRSSSSSVRSSSRNR